jgi:hypothetical protein
MRKGRLLCALMMVAGLAVSSIASADHHGHHGSVGFYFGVPYPHVYYPPPYYYYPYPPYPYYPPVVTAPAQPPVYIEQGNDQPAPQPAPAPQAGNYWYHCDNPDGFYPYIKECAAGWQKVVPTPPPQPQ